VTVNTIHVHQIWLQGRAAIPDDVARAMRTWVEATRRRRPFQHVLWDDAGIRALLPHVAVPGIAAIYEGVPEHLYGIRADIARLVVLFHFGGLYADADTRVLRPEPLLDHFERALVVNGDDAVVGVADLRGMTRRWIEATRRPSNFLVGCREGSAFIERYLRSVVEDFETGAIARHLARSDAWSRHRDRRLTKRWTGPRKLRRLIGATPRGAVPVRLTPVGFVACGHQRCFPDAVLAHDYRASWYRASRSWRRIRDAGLSALLSTPLDACLIGVALSVLAWAVVVSAPV
jgi:hypothetical protein